MKSRTYVGVVCKLKLVGGRDGDGRAAVSIGWCQ